MKYFKKAYNLFKNKYILTGLIFIIWISFFDSYSLVKKYNVNKKLTQLKLDKKYYLDQIKRDSTSLLQLLTGPENLEKFAREKYLMKKDSEDIYVVVKTPTKNK